MKVLNWVHRRFLNVHSCTVFPQEDGAEKDLRLNAANDKHVLLEHMHAQHDDHWHDGILSIGTIAISPLDAFKYGILEEADDVCDQEIAIVHDPEADVSDKYYDLDGDDDEASPLMNVEYFSHELEKIIGVNHEIIEEEVNEHDVVELKDTTCDGTADENEGLMTKRRVTLADLFLEDSDHHPEVNVLNEQEDGVVVVVVVEDGTYSRKLSVEMGVKRTTRSKYGISKAKKLIKEDLHPLKKFNQLMKKMMKKKIHPDNEGKIQKDMQMNPNYVHSNLTNKQDPAKNELASLLLIQDVMV